MARQGARKIGGDKAERILEAAVRVFARKGFFNARVSEIAQAANVADGTIYLYFRNKDDILIQLFESKMAVIITELESLLAETDDPAEQLRRMVVFHLQLVAEYPALAEVLTVELRQSSKFMKEYDAPGFQAYLGIISRIVRTGKDRGLFRPEIMPGVIKRALFGAMDELSCQWILMKDNKKYDPVEAAEQIASVFLRGMVVESQFPREPLHT